MIQHGWQPATLVWFMENLIVQQHPRQLDKMHEILQPHYSTCRHRNVLKLFSNPLAIISLSHVAI